MIFEEAAGLVDIDLTWQGRQPAGATPVCLEPFARGGRLTAEQAAACLGLATTDIRIEGHPPVVASVGLPFLIVELATRDALRRGRLDKVAHGRVLPLDGAHSVYVYTQDSDEAGADVRARMFTAFLAEDPATGSATAAASALLAEVRGSDDLALRVRQGVDMGRPSTLLTRVIR
jgi:trans-2,3-dihydro-3-hydroxyanthranilate isomerase